MSHNYWQLKIGKRLNWFCYKILKIAHTWFIRLHRHTTAKSETLWNIRKHKEIIRRHNKDKLNQLNTYCKIRALQCHLEPPMKPIYENFTMSVSIKQKLVINMLIPLCSSYHLTSSSCVSHNYALMRNIDCYCVIFHLHLPLSVLMNLPLGGPWCCQFLPPTPSMHLLHVSTENHFLTPFCSFQEI